MQDKTYDNNGKYFASTAAVGVPLEATGYILENYRIQTHYFFSL